MTDLSFSFGWHKSVYALYINSEELAQRTNPERKHVPYLFKLYPHYDCPAHEIVACTYKFDDANGVTRKEPVKPFVGDQVALDRILCGAELKPYRGENLHVPFSGGHDLGDARVHLHSLQDLSPAKRGIVRSLEEFEELKDAKHRLLLMDAANRPLWKDLVELKGYLPSWKDVTQYFSNHK